MIWSMFKIMALKLLRDRGSLALAFLLPGFIYTIFATIFSAASGGDLNLRVAMAVTSQAPNAQHLAGILENSSDMTVIFQPNWNEIHVATYVNEHKADIGLIITNELTQNEASPITLIYEPSREIAADILSAFVQTTIAKHMPHILLNQQADQLEGLIGPYSDAQSDRLKLVLDNIRLQRSDNEIQSAGLIKKQSSLHEIRAASFQGDASIAYYAGATAILFLLFSAMQGAAISLEERQNGTTQRLLLGPSGARQLLVGKFLFITLQGFLQALIILAVGAVIFNLPVLENIFALGFISLAAASAAAGLSLLLAALSNSAVQMHTISTFTVLLLSAIGGSMVPRFMMPQWLQDLGRFTPNAHAIDGFYQVLARGYSALEIIQPSFILITVAAICVLAASFLSHKLMRY